jgi:hypothetical protein
MIGCGFP